MSIPQNQEELKKFRDDLDKLDVEAIKEKLRHHHYGMKDSWKTKEAEAKIQREEAIAEQKLKNESLALQAEGNKISREANVIAKRAFWISLVALLISIAVVIFK